MFTSHPLRLDWTQELPQHWNDNSPFKTHFLNALSVTFPDGERFFIDSIKAFKDRIDNTEQLAEIQEFIKQENWHRHLHIQYNEWLERNGLPAKEIETEMGNFWNSLHKRFRPETCLAVTICVEHITAVNAELFLSYRTTLKRMHPHFEQVWRWHGIEEIEHKAIAMDVYNAINVSTWRRRLAMCFVLVYYTYFMSKNTIRFLHADKQLWKWQTLKDAWSLMFDKQSGLIRCSTKHMWNFMRADWHPNQTDHSILMKYSKE